jgi:serine/threonine protein kinase
MLNEIRIYSKIGYHSNICTMLGYVVSDQMTCLLLELAQSDLLSALAQMKERMSNNDDHGNVIRYLHNIAMQIADGMVHILFLNILQVNRAFFQLYIAAKKLIHRDLAARNVLLSSENRAMVQSCVYLVLK